MNARLTVYGIRDNPYPVIVRTKASILAYIGLALVSTLLLSGCNGNSSVLTKRESPLPAAVPSTVESVTWEVAAHAMPPALRPLYDRFGIVLAPVPAGEFTMGDPTGNGDEDERPAHTVYTDAFWIGLTEITNRQYRTFVETGGYADPSLWSDIGWAWREEEAATQPACWSVPDAHPSGMPLSCANWYEADAYLRWLRRETGLAVRLPTEAEWEKAARGPDGRMYPWGNERPEPNRANLFGMADGAAFASIPGAYADGASPYGLMDMSGNVWEWTSTAYDDYPYDAQDGREDPSSDRDRVVRGGAWASSAEQARTTARYKDDLDDWDGLQGFRIALTP